MTPIVVRLSSELSSLSFDPEEIALNQISVALEDGKPVAEIVHLPPTNYARYAASIVAYVLESDGKTRVSTPYQAELPLDEDRAVFSVVPALLGTYAQAVEKSEEE